MIGGLRRYGEMGLRLAIGEDKCHVYGSIIIESLIIGIYRRQTAQLFKELET